VYISQKTRVAKYLGAPSFVPSYTIASSCSSLTHMSATIPLFRRQYHYMGSRSHASFGGNIIWRVLCPAIFVGSVASLTPTLARDIDEAYLTRTLVQECAKVVWRPVLS
jgi:hypothetical protein